MKKLFFFLSVVLLMTSCNVSKKISYFQDAKGIDTVRNETSATEIRLRPQDKISIIVNCKDNELSARFNMPYVSGSIGSLGGQSPYSQGIVGYIVDQDGNIDFPELGTLHVAGMTREEVASMVKSELESRNWAKEPVVTVEYMNMQFYMLGEVESPGKYDINRDGLTILDAISMAGDLTIAGRRDNVRVLRTDSTGLLSTYAVDLRSLERVKLSPVYYLQQGDVVYVEPNAKQARESTVNGNSVLQPAFWISICSFFATMTTTVMMIMSRTK